LPSPGVETAQGGAPSSLPRDRNTGAAGPQVRDCGSADCERDDPVGIDQLRSAVRIRGLSETCRINYRMRGWVDGPILVSGGREVGTPEILAVGRSAGRVRSDLSDDSAASTEEGRP